MTLTVLGHAVADERDLELLLARYGIPVERWGAGQARTVAKLHTELADGECELLVAQRGLLRVVHGVTVTITDPDGRLLAEDRQEYPDGRVVRRALDFSIGEKRRPGEDPEAAARRALSEELAITEPVTLTPRGSERKDRLSVAYPGVTSRYITDRFAACLPQHLVRDEYVEAQSDKRSVFCWRTAAWSTAAS